jgi:hypothetical protein
MMGVSGVLEGELVEDLLTCFCRAEAFGCENVYDVLERTLKSSEGLWKCLVRYKVGTPNRTGDRLVRHRSRAGEDERTAVGEGLGGPRRMIDPV